MDLGAGVRDATAEAIDTDRASGFVCVDLEAERLECGDEDAGVAAEQCSSEKRDAIGERGQDEGAVGDAL